LRPRAGWLEKEATDSPSARADSRLQALPVIVFILRLRPLRDHRGALVTELPSPG